MSLLHADKILNSSKHGVYGRGPLTATLCVLKDLGWSVRALDDWRDPHDVGRDGDCARLLQVVRMQLEHRMWVQASRHQGGSGLADGVDLTVPRKQLKRLLKQGDRKQYNALLHVFQGTLGTADNGIGEVCSGCGCASPTLIDAQAMAASLCHAKGR